MVGQGGGKEEEVSFTRAYLWLVACYGVVLLSFWVLWKISFWALAIYLGRRNNTDLCPLCVAVDGVGLSVQGW